MKKMLKDLALGTGILMLMIAFLAICGRPIRRMSEDIKGKTYYVCYNEVNLRSEPSQQSEIVGQKVLGQKVQLSGESVTYPLSDAHGIWYQTTDGVWITGEALLDSVDYDLRF